MDEFELISRYMKPLAAEEAGALGLADDAAVLKLPPGGDLVVTTDMLVAGIHFRADDPPDSVGVKALAVNLSDLAAMGAEPRAYVLALALPAPWSDSQRGDWLAAFTAGLAEAQREFAVALAGGDTVATPGPLSIAITAIGASRPAGTLLRSAAQCGDQVWVSGTIGDAALGLMVLAGTLTLGDAALEQELADRYRRPRPRLALGRRLAGRAHACADVSDGLLADLGHICEASSKTATIDRDRIPLSIAARAAIEAQPALWATVLTGGDDYELVFTAAAGDSARIQEAAARSGTQVTQIGGISAAAPPSGTPSAMVAVRGRDGHPLAFQASGWRYFSNT